MKGCDIAKNHAPLAGRMLLITSMDTGPFSLDNRRSVAQGAA